MRGGRERGVEEYDESVGMAKMKRRDDDNYDECCGYSD